MMMRIRVGAHSFILFTFVGLMMPPAIAVSPSMSLKGGTPPPIGHVQFCALHPAECRPYGQPARIVRLTDAIWAHLHRINLAVNSAVLPATDLEIFGALENWDYPSLVGDCEDYVLEKQRLLIESGWPASALLITIVRDEAGAGHAVLTARTDQGDFILDNRNAAILPWNEAPYRFIKRQSTRSPAQWDAISDARRLRLRLARP